MTDAPDEAVLRAAAKLVDELIANSQVADFEQADYWIVELRDPQTGHVTRAGVWPADQQHEAVAWAFKVEAQLNEGLEEDELPYSCTVQPVSDHGS